MKVDVYTATGTKKGTVDLPAALFGASVNEGLMHQALVRQQGNRRNAIAHVKSRGEVQGSTRKLFAQKGTGRARRGSVRSPLLRGGGKAFGPRNDANFTKNMPRSMRRAALKSCLSLQAKNEKILGLENYPEEIKTKTVMELLKKMPVEIGRKIVFVLPGSHPSLARSVRNIPNIKTVQAAYLNPEDVLGAHHLIFFVDALKKAEEVFGGAASNSIKATSDKAASGKRAVSKKEKGSQDDETAHSPLPTKKVAPKATKKKSTPKKK